MSLILDPQLGVFANKIHLDNESCKWQEVINPGHIENTQGLINESETLEHTVIIVFVFSK